jgi:hypothetical protein
VGCHGTSVSCASAEWAPSLVPCFAWRLWHAPRLAAGGVHHGAAAAELARLGCRARAAVVVRVVGQVAPIAPQLGLRQLHLVTKMPDSVGSNC